MRYRSLLYKTMLSNIILFIIFFLTLTDTSAQANDDFPTKLTLPNNQKVNIRANDIIAPGGPTLGECFALIKEYSPEICMYVRHNIYQMLVYFFKYNQSYEYLCNTINILSQFERTFETKYKEAIIEYDNRNKSIENINQLNLDYQIFSKMLNIWVKHCVNQGKASYATPQQTLGYINLPSTRKNTRMAFCIQPTYTLTFCLSKDSEDMTYPDARDGEYYYTQMYGPYYPTTRKAPCFVYEEEILTNDFLKLAHREISGSPYITFKLIHGEHGETPYSAPPFFIKESNPNQSLLHGMSSPMYEPLKALLRGKNIRLIPLPEDFKDSCALALEVIEYLNKLSQPVISTDVAPADTASVKFIPTKKLEAQQNAQEGGSLTPSKLRNEKVERARALVIGAPAPTSELQIFCQEAEKAEETAKSEVRRIEEAFYNECVRLEQERISSRVANDVIDSKKCRKRGKYHQKTPTSAPDVGAPALVTPEALDQIMATAQVDLAAKRVKYKTLACIIAEMINEMPPEVQEQLSMTRNGSHQVLHAKGAQNTITLVEPHGGADAMVSGKRAQTIVMNVVDMLRSAVEATASAPSQHTFTEGG